MQQIDALDDAIVKIDREVEAGMAPFRSAVEQLSTIPGGKGLGALAILSEIGIDMSRFATNANLVSWACICPRNDESAGERRSSRIRQGSPWLKMTLVKCAGGLLLPAARDLCGFQDVQFGVVPSNTVSFRYMQHHPLQLAPVAT